ncbi:MAG: low temperature requirement protein A, partial [Gemmatimonadota bacterium]|nr:low temperature requirement protein A [Gemmatimonadota bacterium]
FEETGVVFAVGYLMVTSVHLLLFTQADIGRAMGWLAAYNLSSALLVLAGGFAHGTARYMLWFAALALQMVIPYLVPRLSWMGLVSSFRIVPEHLVERHGLLVIIALGESVVAIGMGVDVEHLTAGILGAIVLALLLPGAFWWTYFSDVRAAEHTLAAVDTEQRSLMAIRAYFFAHIPLLLGIVAAAAGIHAAIAHPGDPAQWRAAVALAGGVALFLAGVGVFRRALAIGAATSRVVAGLVVLATIPIATRASAGLHLASVVIVVTVMLLVDAWRRAAKAATEEGYDLRPAGG